MKIAIIDPVGKKAGMNNYDVGLAMGLKESGAQPIIYSNFSESVKEIEVQNIFDFEKYNPLKMLVRFITAHLKILSDCKKRGIDIVILHVFSTVSKDFIEFLLVKSFGIPIIAIVHDVESFGDNDSSFYRNWMYQKSSYLVVHNNFSRQEIKQYVSKDIFKKVHVIKHGNFIDFIPSENQSETYSMMPNLSASKKYLLFFGQIKKVKGLDVLIKSLPHLHENINLIIAGRPHRDDISEYNKLIEELGVEERIIKIIRFIKDEERDYLFKNSDALVLPYKKIFQSGVLLLAMSHGIPVIASDLSPNREVIQDGENGLLFESENHQDLAFKIKQLFEMEEFEESIGENAILHMKNEYDWNKIGNEYITMIEG